MAVLRTWLLTVLCLGIVAGALIGVALYFVVFAPRSGFGAMNAPLRSAAVSAASATSGTGSAGLSTRGSLRGSATMSARTGSGRGTDALVTFWVRIGWV